MRTILRFSPALFALLLLAAPVWGQLDLPRSARPGRPSSTEVRPSKKAPSAAAEARPARQEPEGSPLDRVLAGLEGMREAAGPEFEARVEEWSKLGADGLAAARAALPSEHGPLLLGAVRLLLSGGDALDRARVLSRAGQRLPGRAIAAVFEALEATQPASEGPEVWLPLLDHPQASARARVSAHITRRAGPELLPYLVPVLQVRRSEAREEVLHIAETIEDPGTLPIFLDRLGDRSSKVAALAASHLATRDDGRVVAELLERALPSSEPIGNAEERAVAYALLAIVEREDRRGTPILTGEHVPLLLERLSSPNQALSGACALALAGVGFRSPDPLATPWLDLEVPHELVKIVSGAVFHADFSSLVTPGVRRLARLSGQTFGGNGPEWQAWWTRNAGTFRARRAILAAPPEAASEMRVVLSAPRGDSFELRGPGLVAREGADPKAGSDVETFYITEQESLDLLGALRREGLFGAGRLPGPETPGMSTIGVHVGDQAKVFTLRDGALEPWLASARDYVFALRTRNDWQRFPDPAEGRSRHAFWEAEASWWAGEHSDAERRHRLAEHVLTWLEGTPALERAPGLSALEAAYAMPAAVGADHFARLLDLLRAESPGSVRVPRVAGLALAAGTVDGPLTANRAFVLEEVLVPLLLPSMSESLEELFRVSEDEVARAAALDERAPVRAAAARALAQRKDPASQRGLEALVGDPDPDVASAALLALAEEAAARPGMIDVDLRQRIFELALDPRAAVRAAALGVLAHLRGEEADVLLRRGLAASDVNVRRQAARGVAQSATLETVPLLLSLLAEGEDPLVRETARHGLVRIGEPAWPDLLRATHRASGALSRDASLVLAQQGVPEVASTLLARLTQNPGDSRVAWELAVLTCIDMRSAPDPAGAWWEWWDLVVHEDSGAWLRAALERVDIAAPSSEELQAGTPGAAEALVEALEKGDAALVERARRELSRMLDEELDDAPAGEADRIAWRAAISEKIRSRWRD